MPSPSDFGPLPYRVHFAYSARGTSAAAERGRRVRDWMKQGRRPEAVVRRMHEESVARGVRLGGYLDADAVLVPVPRSAPRRDDALWPALELCVALRDAGLGASVERLLERVAAVPKSAFIRRAAARPSPGTHAESLRAVGTLVDAASVTLVDDVVTRGSTLLGCAAVLRAARPGLTVRAFAFLRAVDGLDDHHAPHEGTVTLIGENVVQAR